MLLQLRVACDSFMQACTVTEARIQHAASLLAPPDITNAVLFCESISKLANVLGDPGCHKILNAGCIPVLFACLRSWPFEKDIVRSAIFAIFSLLSAVSVLLKPVISCILKVADHSTLLCDASATGFDELGDGNSAAFAILTEVLKHRYVLH